MYMALIEIVVSSILCSFMNDKMMHVYYVSHILTGAEIRYSPLEKKYIHTHRHGKEAKTIIQAHPIIVLTTVPLRHVMHKPDLTRRMTKWVLELSEYEIDFKPRRAMQAQALVNFVVENTLLIALEPETLGQTPDPKRT